jgi:hypothetical protein
MCLYENIKEGIIIWLLNFRKLNRQLKTSLVSQQNIFKKQSSHNESVVCTGFIVAEIIATEESLFAYI